MSEHIWSERGDPDAWHCLCGNTSADSGFFPINGDRHEVEPTPTAWTTGQYCCDDCGRVVEPSTLRVVRRAERKQVVRLLTPDGAGASR